MSKIKVIIDTDPGIDDLLALSVASASDKLDILAISTVHGNVSLEKTTKNALLISDILELSIPIYMGSDKPLFINRKGTSVVHGEDGLGNLYSKFRKRASENSKVTGGLPELDNLINNTEEKISIIALGPLTNIAKLILINEDITNKIDKIYIMGGGFSLGNINELTEFNFFSDSHAAKIVFDSKIPIMLSPLDLTHTIYFTKGEFNALSSRNLKLELLKETITYYSNLDPYMHDTCAVLSVTNPELFSSEMRSVDIVVGSGIADGQSYKKNFEDIKNTTILTSGDREKIISQIIKSINEKYK